LAKWAFLIRYAKRAGNFTARTALEEVPLHGNATHKESTACLRFSNGFHVLLPFLINAPFTCVTFFTA